MILDKIVANIRRELPQRKREQPAAALRERLADLPPTLDLCTILHRPGVSIIAEIKRASPSRGAMNLGLNPAEMAVTYAFAGADAISVLTEKQHFHGSPDDLIAVRAALQQSGIACPILRKDFIVDPYQLLEARVWGADAVLLIAAVLDDATLADLAEQSQALSLTPLIEVHNREELERVLPLKPQLVGINNRNLNDFTVDMTTTATLRPLIPAPTAVISESGIHTPEQLRELAGLGVDAVLIGEALVTAQDPAIALRAFKSAGAVAPGASGAAL